MTTTQSIKGPLQPAIADPILKKQEVSKLVDLSPATIDRLRARNEFPPPVKLSTRRVGWRHSAIQEWLSSR
jgi:predicted DNA-binding transcriptional regulator AlpA